MAEENGTTPSSAEELIKNLRALVREESLTPPAAASAPTYSPTWKDAIWLGVLLTDAALLSYWFPENAKGPLEFVKSLAPWLAGGAFVIWSNWFRDHLLEWSRNPAVRVVMVAFLVVGITTGVNVIPVKPAISPLGTLLRIDPDKDDKPKPTDETLWLALRNHTVQLGPAGPQDPVQDVRKIELSWWRVLQASWSSEQCDWRRLYKTAIVAPKAGKVLIRPIEAPFESDYLEHARVSHWGEKEEDAPTHRFNLAYQADSQGNLHPLFLPWGSYWIAMEGCAPQKWEVRETFSSLDLECKQP
jgi:hypothetical protein